MNLYLDIYVQIDNLILYIKEAYEQIRLELLVLNNLKMLQFLYNH